MSTIRGQLKVPFEILNDEPGTDETVQSEHYSFRDDDENYQEQGAEDDTDSETSEESDGEVSASVREDMDQLHATFQGVKDRFRLINRIGEGTFSTVYKAEDLLHDHFHQSWDITFPGFCMSASEKRRDRKRLSRTKPKYVAIKKIYVTSSPFRILNELDLLNDLRGAESVCPLITAFRQTDQVVAVLPYFQHTDFRTYFRKMTVVDMSIYFRSLFTALEAVHKQGILHRDIKPTNFLYEPRKRRGVLVDFGLAEREGTDSGHCLCSEVAQVRRRRVMNSIAAQSGPSTGYPKNDSRPSRRANRAGTRGFRAPEVLFKCTSQTTKIDIWSAGVILLTILSRRFPFFNSEDDVEAMIEIGTIFGQKRMKQAAYLHGTSFESNIPTIGTHGFTLAKIILWSTCRTEQANGNGTSEAGKLDREEEVAVGFLSQCLDLDPNRRFSASEALRHPFLRDYEGDFIPGYGFTRPYSHDYDGYSMWGDREAEEEADEMQLL